MMRSIFSRSFPGFPGSFLLLISTLLLPFSLAAQAPPPDESPSYARVEAGHSGMWFDPSRSGEGWMLEVRPDDAAVVYWFTFDDEGKPRWLTGSGRIERGENGDEIRFDELIAVHGPAFGPDYDPDDAVFERQGQASFRFLDCDRAEIHFDAYGQQLEVPLFHLTRTMGAKGCRPIHGTPGEPVQPHAGQSGSWYDPAYNGQGFALGWMPNGDAALVWFTFDAEGRPYWLTGVGRLGDDERIVFDELEAVSGGRFGEAFDPDEVVRSHWGRIELTLECDVGQAHYFPTEEGFAEGRFDLQRLTRLESPDCPWVKPKLTDLYDIVVTELPAPVPVDPGPGQHGSGDLVTPVGVANDGTLVALKKVHWGNSIAYKAQRLRPGETEWSDVYSMYADGIFVSADGQSILLDPMTGEARVYRGSEVLPVPGLEGAESNRVVSVSDDLSHVLGWAIVRTQDGQGWMRNWVGGIGKPAKLLAVSDELPGPSASCISNDGATILGDDAQGQIANYPLWTVRWQGEAMPGYLYDASGVPLADPSACARDGSVVYGTVPIEIGAGGAWLLGLPGYITRGGTSGVLGSIAATPEQPYGWRHRVTVASTNGTLVGGVYASPEIEHRAWAALLWTQDTGHVLLPELLEELGAALDWPSMTVQAVSASGEYVILNSGEIFDSVQLPPDTSRRSSSHSALLRLVPRQ